MGCPHPRAVENSVQRRIFRHTRDERELSPFALQDGSPKGFWVITEDIGGPGWVNDPVVARELVFKLTGTPAGVAREDADTPGAVDDVGQLAEAGDEDDVVEDRLLRPRPLRPQHGR